MMIIIEHALYLWQNICVLMSLCYSNYKFFQHSHCPFSLASLCLDIRNTRQLESPLVQNGLVQGSVAYYMIRLAVTLGLIRAEMASVGPVLDLLVLKNKVDGQK